MYLLSNIRCPFFLLDDTKLSPLSYPVPLYLLLFLNTHNLFQKGKILTVFCNACHYSKIAYMARQKALSIMVSEAHKPFY